MSQKLITKGAHQLLAGLAAVFFALTPARALTPVNSCGAVLDTPGGHYVLASDLDCSGTMTDGVRIGASNVVFNLAGHTIASTDCDSTKSINGVFVPGG